MPKSDLAKTIIIIIIAQAAKIGKKKDYGAKGIASQPFKILFIKNRALHSDQLFDTFSKIAKQHKGTKDAQAFCNVHFHFCCRGIVKHDKV